MRRRKLLRRLTWLGVIAVAIAAIAWALRARPVAVETVAVTRGPLTATVVGEGRTRVRDLFVVSAPVDGQLQRISLQPGDPVTVNAVVAHIQPIEPRPLDARSRAEARASVAVARAAVERARAAELEAIVAAEHADSERVRSEKLAQTGAVAKAEAEHAGHQSGIRHHAVEAAHAGVREARAELVRANAVLAPATAPGDSPVAIASPVTGRVLRVLRESAGPVAAGTPLIEIGDVTNLEIRADLLSSDAASVREGATATITGWGGAKPLAARVRRIEPAAFTKISALGLEEQRVHIVLDLTDPLPAGLGHDFRIDLAIATWSTNSVLRVPSRSLFRAGDRWALFAVRDGRAHQVFVDVGETDGSLTVIQHGLVEGDRIIAQPSDAVIDGTLVRT